MVLFNCCVIFVRLFISFRPITFLLETALSLENRGRVFFILRNKIVWMPWWRFSGLRNHTENVDVGLLGWTPRGRRLDMKMESGCFSETLVSVHRFTHFNPEEQYSQTEIRFYVCVGFGLKFSLVETTWRRIIILKWILCFSGSWQTLTQ